MKNKHHLIFTATFIWIATPSTRVGFLRALAVSLRSFYFVAWNAIAAANWIIIYVAGAGNDFRGACQESAGNQGHQDPRTNGRHWLFFKTFKHYYNVIKLKVGHKLEKLLISSYMQMHAAKDIYIYIFLEWEFGG